MRQRKFLLETVTVETQTEDAPVEQGNVGGEGGNVGSKQFKMPPPRLCGKGLSKPTPTGEIQFKAPPKNMGAPPVATVQGEQIFYQTSPRSSTRADKGAGGWAAPLS